MAHGYWGSRFPVLNLIISRLFFFFVRYRVNSLRRRNLLKGVPGSLKSQNDPGNIFNAWLAQGYDKINIGGGRKNLSGFINIDFVQHLGVEREVLADIRDLSFIPDNSISHVHSNHVIEHLSENDIMAQMNMYRRILKENGLLSVRVPNALGAAFGFWFEPILEEERQAYLELGYPFEDDFGNDQDKWMHKDFYGILHWFYGDVGNVENEHKTILTPTKLSSLIERGGFHILLISKPEAINIVVLAEKL